MTRICTLIALSWALAGCAGALPDPQPLEVDNLARYQADKQVCKTLAANWHAQFDFGEVAYQTAAGAASNATGTAVGGLAIPAIGAAGGGTTAIINGFDVMGHAQANVYRHCIDDMTKRDGSAIIANSND